MSADHPLPPLPVWHARSFYASVLLILTVGCNAVGISLLPLLARLGLGATDTQVIDSIMQIAPLVFGLWAWVERRAPRFRLCWRRLRGIDQ